MTIKTAFPNEFNLIRSIAERTWPVAYGEILSKDQLDYMMEMMYSDRALTRNYEDGVQFLLAGHDEDFLAFAGFQHDYGQKGNTHVHKIYVLPEAQGKNIGRMLMHAIEQYALQAGASAVTLNVNRRNKARHFYARLGFEIAETVDIPIGNGYLMEDYIMRKPL